MHNYVNTIVENCMIVTEKILRVRWNWIDKVQILNIVVIRCTACDWIRIKVRSKQLISQILALFRSLIVINLLQFRSLAPELFKQFKIMIIALETFLITKKRLGAIDWVKILFVYWIFRKVISLIFVLCWIYSSHVAKKLRLFNI